MRCKLSTEDTYCLIILVVIMIIAAASAWLRH